MQPSIWGSNIYSITVNCPKPTAREALVHFPKGYDGSHAVPLILAFHGKAQPAAEFEEHTRLSDPAVQDEFIVVYPEGINLTWTGDPEAPSREDLDDIAFVGDLLDQLERDYVIDKPRIYAAGFSNGGGLTDLLAGDHALSGRIGAFAIASGAFYTDSALKEPLFSHANPAHLPVPLLEFHGDADPVIHYDGKSTPDGVTFSLPDFFEIWVKRNKLPPEPMVEEMYDGKVTRLSWPELPTGSSSRDVLIHYRIQGFGHGWPTRRPLNNDDQRHGSTYFDATPIVLEFFKKW